MSASSRSTVTGTGSSSVLSYQDYTYFPASGSIGYVYIDQANADLYLWTGTVFELQSGSGGGSGADTALSNLASTAVNADIIPATNGVKSLGAATFKWLYGYFQTVKTSSIEGNNPYISFSTTTANGEFNFIGNINHFRNGASNSIKLYDNTEGDYVGLGVQDTLGITTDYTLPTTDGGSGQFLKTDGAGVLGWDSVNDATLGVSRIYLGADYTGNQQYTTNYVTGLDFSLVAGQTYELDYRLIMYLAGSGGIGTYLTFPTNTKIALGTNQAQVGTFPTSLTPASDSHFGDFLPPATSQYFVWDYSVLIMDVQNSGTFSFGFRSGGATDVTIVAGSRLKIKRLT